MKQERLLEREKSIYNKVDAPCQYFGRCGGCALQDLAYEDQLRLKHQRLQRIFAELGAVPAFDIVGLEEPWRYRNKAEFTFGTVDGVIVLGYHAAGSFWRVIDLDDCLLLPEPVMRMLRDLLALVRQTELPAYQPRSHQGFFRYAVVRYSHATQQVMLCLVTASGAREVAERLAVSVCRRHPAIAGMFWGVTDRLADVAQPERLTLVHGSPWLEEQVGPFRLTLGPLSFLQPTLAQAERLYAALDETLADAAGGVAWDLYCGVGVIALYLSRSFDTVYAIDSEPAHVELAAKNAIANGVTNVDYRAGRVEELLRDRRVWLGPAKPDVIVVDPPRAGLHSSAIASILSARPKRLAYISCNAQSLVRDLRLLSSSFPRYRLSHLRAFDMFPQTNHVETLAVLQRQ